MMEALERETLIKDFQGSSNMIFYIPFALFLHICAPYKNVFPHLKCLKCQRIECLRKCLPVKYIKSGHPPSFFCTLKFGGFWESTGGIREPVKNYLADFVR